MQRYGGGSKKDNGEVKEWFDLFKEWASVGHKQQPTETHNMSATIKFLSVIDSKTKAAILGNIATNYGITAADAFAEVTAPDAERLLDYITGPARLATSALMQRHGIN